MNRNLRIIYMGTPAFAVEPLRAILAAGYTVVAVITAPDKPAGRGQKPHSSPVKDFALSRNLPVIQPLSLKNSDFLNELKSYQANLQVVVAFRMLPEAVWQMPEYGTLNLHASLLPQYRGAAPINHAIINGETETGLTTFFLEKEIDTGNVILSLKHKILPLDNAGILHDQLMLLGGKLMAETLKLIETGNIKLRKQEDILPNETILHPAPKIFKNDCRINWELPTIRIHNLVRGLSPYPGAFSMLVSESDTSKQVKLFKTSFSIENTNAPVGSIITDNKKTLSVTTNDGIISIEELQMEGKRRMTVSEFLCGVTITSDFRFE